MLWEQIMLKSLPEHVLKMNLSLCQWISWSLDIRSLWHKLRLCYMYMYDACPCIMHDALFALWPLCVLVHCLYFQGLPFPCVGFLCSPCFLCYCCQIYKMLFYLTFLISQHWLGKTLTAQCSGLLICWDH